MQKNELPSFVDPEDKIVLFDGVCKLCNGWAKFLINKDKDKLLKLASVQSAEGQALLAWCGLPLDHFDSIVYIEKGRFYLQTDAVLKVLHQLPAPWSFTRIVKIIPAFLRNWIYDRIALNRYFLFGKHDTCLLPMPEYSERFLHADK